MDLRGTAWLKKKVSMGCGHPGTIFTRENGTAQCPSAQGISVYLAGVGAELGQNELVHSHHQWAAGIALVFFRQWLTAHLGQEVGFDHTRLARAAIGVKARWAQRRFESVCVCVCGPAGKQAPHLVGHGSRRLGGGHVGAIPDGKNVGVFDVLQRLLVHVHIAVGCRQRT